MPWFLPLGDPIDTRNHRPYSLIFLRLPGHTRALNPGQKEWSLGVTGANDIRIGPGLLEDGETWRWNFRYREGGKQGDVFVEIPLLVRGGGWMDPWIDGWHKSVLRAKYADRENSPMSRIAYRLPNGQNFGSGSGIGDVVVGLTKNLTPRTAAKVALKLPTGNPTELLGSGSPDFGFSVVHRVPGKKWTASLEVGLVAQGKATRLRGAPALSEQAILTGIYRPSAREEWILQWQHEKAPVRTGVNSADQPHRLLTLGYRIQCAEGKWLELYFSEDQDIVNGRVPWLARVGPDFTAGLRWIVRW